MKRFVGTLALAFGLGVVSMSAQGSSLVGTWERTSLLNAEGKPTQPPAPAAYLIFSADGHFTQIAIPTGRAKVNKPVDQMTREELVARFNRVEARGGSYTVAGNRLTRKNERHGDPNQEGTDAVQLFRVEGDTLVLSSADPKQKNEARWRRVK
jgi:hypothetical protein